VESTVRRAGWERKWPQYRYDHARFNLGRSYSLTSQNLDGTSFTEEFDEEHLFTHWSSDMHHTRLRPGIIYIPVSCGDILRFQMGNVGYYEFQREYTITE
jgi:hypothetical protein